MSSQKRKNINLIQSFFVLNFAFFAYKKKETEKSKKEGGLKLRKIDNKTKNEIGRRVRAVLTLSSYSIREIAEISHFPYQSLQNWMRGRYLVGSDFLLWLAKKGVNVNWILLGQGEMFLNQDKFRKELIEK